ncbi:MAG: dTMP kinase [Gammaproteobacteria bacterium]|nr:dTMP kinase [Gammaproteobacteria bacterium]MBU6509518.1 dTMP kinase [Gammaproteobacteria bacterium]MDE1984249.1 dTMP kinase [Gammaproteobacteria bacterium]MDE2108350.1 dTMP kinase [Gammaproteobacteria bacterium]MDE2461082.1 dTMP kinase [Gammaproteobacteria bacterium]
MTRFGQSKRTRFITLEGIEGVGKSTHLKFIADWLRAHGSKPLVTREPGGTRLADEIRRLLLTPRSQPVAPMAELLLMFAARASHIEQLVRPALISGRWVLCDRFTDASYAYQGGGRRLPQRQIAALEHMVTRGLKPDLTLLLDAPVPVGMTRVRRRGARDRFELERQAFFERVRRVYLRRARNEPRRVRIIRADVSLSAVREQILNVLQQCVLPWL